MTDDPGALIRASVDRLVAASTRQHCLLARLLGLRSADGSALHHITHCDSMTPSELARRLQMSSGGVTAVVDRLVLADLVMRLPDPSSRRRTLLRATPRGRAVTADRLAQLVVDIAALSAELSASEMATVERFLVRLADLAERHADRLTTEAERNAMVATGLPPVIWG